MRNSCLHKELEQTEKIRILIGIATNRSTLDFIQEVKQQELQFSHTETKDRFSDLIAKEMTKAKDSKEVEDVKYSIKLCRLAKKLGSVLEQTK